MKSITNEFSFILKPSLYGIGVFASHNIAKGTYLVLFADEEDASPESLERPKESVPEYFRQYCIDRGDKICCPRNFSAMPVGWYMNHSKTPNAVHDDKYRYYATRDIYEGEEITIDYNSLEESENVKDDYYKP